MYETLPLHVRPGIAGADLEEAASDYAWQHRWDQWPATWQELVSALGETPPLASTYAVARRLHFHFAHAALCDFTHAALTTFPADTFLTQLHDAALAVLGDPSAWAPLLRTATGGTSKSAHVLLTTAFVAASVPAGTLSAAIGIAEGLASSGDAVAAYRAVSLQRRAGRNLEALNACEAACLAAANAGPALGDHLAERLLVERHLITTQLDQAAAAHQPPA